MTQPIQPLTRQACWRQELACAYTSPEQLAAALALPADALMSARSAAQQFSLRVPRGYAARMRRGDLNDPLLKQVWPVADEMERQQGFFGDPVGDLAAMPVPGLLHKYHGRVLLVVGGACAVHCRYCFRRHFPYGQANALARQRDRVLDYIGQDESISEVILSGGDPLSVSDSHLSALVGQLAQIPHVKRLRIHTRLPVMLPERVDNALLAWISAFPRQVIVVFHTNHANEIDQSVARGFARLSTIGVTLLNQSVLLKGVNDDADALCELSEALYASGVLPYYLHMLDKVQGAAHFQVSADYALQLMDIVRQRLPGYLVPNLVYEQAGALSKLPLTGGVRK
ncbi:MAG: EF-P beta-lysylation protein EpmB [Gammaproteobacteria bacterium]|nr:EF-P beta-lysylation protein EpmB [Gammaproteobacteria bacterium]